MIKITDINYRYQEQEIFKNFSLHIKKPENIAIVGRNGSGKSTLAKIISQIITPDSGTLEIKNENDLYLILQNPDNQIFRTRVSEEITFGAENLNMPKDVIIKRLKELSEKLELEELLEKKTNELSGGQKQRMNIASILIMEPKILILDESTSMISTYLKKKLFNYLKEIQKEKQITLIHITHDMNIVEEMDRVIEISLGKITFEGTAESYFQEERSLETPLKHKMEKYLKLQNPKCKNKIFAKEKDIVLKKPSIDSGNEIIKLEKVTYQYPNKITAIKAVDLQFKENTIYGIVGPNGSGKSTLIQLINTLLLPESGNLVLDGEKITAKNKQKNLIKYKRMIGLVFQFSDLQFFAPTVREDLLFVPLNLGLDQKVVLKEIVTLFEKFELNIDLLEQNPNFLSGGEKKKVAIIAILINKPKVLILDEPTTNLDPESKKLLMKIILEIKEKNKMTVILNSHDYDFIWEYGDEIIELNNGVVVEQQKRNQFFKSKIQKYNYYYLPGFLQMLLCYNDKDIKIVYPAAVEELFAEYDLNDFFGMETDGI